MTAAVKKTTPRRKRNELTVAEPVKTQLPAQSVSETAAIILMIERAAMNPDVDIDKMERLLQMHERIKAENAKVAYADALAVMQPLLPIIEERGVIKNNSGGEQSKYALWEDVVGEITPILSQHGFSLSFRTSSDANEVTITGVLLHRAGHSEESELKLPFDKSGSKNVVQAIGSSTSYGQRYTARALLNLRTGQIDNDGAGGGDVTTGEKNQADGQQQNKNGNALPPYPQEEFLKNYPSWENAIVSGKRTTEQIIAMVSTKGALSILQTRAINSIKPQGQPQ